MNTLLSPAPNRLPMLAAEFLARHRALTLFGLVTLALSLPMVAMQAIDPRTLASGISVWVKPSKFFVSVGLFSLTAAWFWGYVRPERRESRALRTAAAVLIVAASLELAWITLQGARGLESHFNLSSPFYAIMYGLMGVAAVLLVGTCLPLAWEIARRPAAGVSRDFAAAVALGLVLTFILGGGLGGYMSAQTGHSVGAEGGHVALFGWNRSGGDLRVAHFLGIHAEQAIPLLAVLVAGKRAAVRWTTLAAGTAAYVAVTLALFFQAVAGRPLLPL